MADRDTDRTRSTAGPGSGPTGNDTRQASSTTEDLKQAGQRAAGQAKDAAKDMAGQAKDAARDMAGQAKEQGRSMFEQQKSSAASQVDSFANAFRNTAGQLQDDGQGQAGHYVGMAAERLESLSRQLRQKDMDTLLHEAEDFGRRSPAVFFAGSVLAGFMLARFLKSSSPRQRRSESDWDDSQRYGADSSDQRRYSAYRSDLADAASTARGSDERASEAGVVGTDPVAGAPLGGIGSAAGSTGGVGVEAVPGGVGSTSTSTSGTQPGGNTHGKR